VTIEPRALHTHTQTHSPTPRPRSTCLAARLSHSPRPCLRNAARLQRHLPLCTSAAAPAAAETHAASQRRHPAARHPLRRRLQVCKVSRTRQRFHPGQCAQSTWRSLDLAPQLTARPHTHMVLPGSGCPDCCPLLDLAARPQHPSQVDNRHQAEPVISPQQAIKLCDRNFGIGGDGVRAAPDAAPDAVPAVSPALLQRPGTAASVDTLMSLPSAPRSPAGHLCAAPQQRHRLQHAHLQLGRLGARDVRQRHPLPRALCGGCAAWGGAWGGA
jgi:hypothetical protein